MIWSYARYSSAVGSKFLKFLLIFANACSYTITSSAPESSPRWLQHKHLFLWDRFPTENCVPAYSNHSGCHSNGGEFICTCGNNMWDHAVCHSADPAGSSRFQYLWTRAHRSARKVAVYSRFRCLTLVHCKTFPVSLTCHLIQRDHLIPVWLVFAEILPCFNTDIALWVALDIFTEFFLLGLILQSLITMGSMYHLFVRVHWITRWAKFVYHLSFTLDGITFTSVDVFWMKFRIDDRCIADRFVSSSINARSNPFCFATLLLCHYNLVILNNSHKSTGLQVVISLCFKIITYIKIIPLIFLFW